MSDGSRFLATFFAGLLGWYIGAALNVPIWRTWEPGDRTDIALTAAVLVWLLTRKAIG